jgi:hypothetical protein
MPYSHTGKNADPDFRHTRAVTAGRASKTPQAYVDAVVRNAGKLTPEQLDQLRALLAKREPEAQT